jgi:hypothetical protein
MTVRAARGKRDHHRIAIMRGNIAGDMAFSFARNALTTISRNAA